MTKKFILAACIAVLALTGCRKDPKPEPQTVSRVASVVITTTLPNNMTMRMASYYSWENGVLVKTLDSVISPITPPFASIQNMTYENGNLTKVEESNGKWQHYYTYEDGLLKTFVDIRDNDTLVAGEITAYTANSEVEEIVIKSLSKENKYHFTWKNGDAVQYVDYAILPVNEADTTTYNIAFDDKPSVYTGFPLGINIGAGDVSFIVTRQSKHNPIDNDFTYTYDEQNRLVSKVSGDKSIYYQYIEQTIE